MKNVFLVLFLFLVNSNAGLLTLDSSTAHPDAVPVLQKFISEVESKLPPKVIEQIQAKFGAIQIQMVNYPSQTEITPGCQIVDSYSKGEAADKIYADKLKSVSGAKFIRYNDQIYSHVNSKNIIFLNIDFQKAIFAGPDRAATYECEHKNTYKLAQGALLSAVGYLFDQTGAYVGGKKSKDIVIYSESSKYRYMSSWTNKDRKIGFWPRAINPYEYASLSENFALNFEFYFLDAEYACRRPLQNDFYSRVFITDGQVFDPFQGKRNCSVNYELKIAHKNIIDEVQSASEEDAMQSIETFDLSPSRIMNVNYLRAGIGKGSGSLGHSMVRFVTCEKGQPFGKACEAIRNFDLIVNPRANPLEMRLEALKGLNGSYPSMFFVTPLYEIKEEYGHQELRNLYNIPFIGKKFTDEFGHEVNVMPDDDKVRFIWATLDQYWNYYGRYKFITNNCADEVFRLYQMASEDPSIWAYDPFIMTPQEVNEVLSKKGKVDQSETESLEPKITIPKMAIGFIFKKDQKWDDFVAQYNNNMAVELNADMSRYYNVLSSVRELMILDANNETNPKKRAKILKETGSVKHILKKSKRFLELTEPDVNWKKVRANQYQDISQLTDKEIANLTESMVDIRNQYLQQINSAEDLQQKLNTARIYNRLMSYVDQKRWEDIGNEVIQLGYSLAYSKDRKSQSKESQMTQERREEIKVAIEDFAETQRAAMPYRETSVKPGYGIPIKQDVVRGKDYMQNLIDQNQRMDELFAILSGYVASDKLIMDVVSDFQLELRREIRDLQAQLAKQ